MDLGVLHKHLRIVREGDRLFIPTTTRVDLDFPTEQREFGEGFVAVRSYKDVVEVPAPLRRSLPSSFDVIGDIVVLKIPNELKRYREEIGRAILRWNPTLRVVVEDHGVRGKRRVRSIEVIAGERRTTTVHTEHGLRYAVDLARGPRHPRSAAHGVRPPGPRVRGARSARRGPCLPNLEAGGRARRGGPHPSHRRTCRHGGQGSSAPHGPRILSHAAPRGVRRHGRSSVTPRWPWYVPERFS